MTNPKDDHPWRAWDNPKQTPRNPDVIKHFFDALENPKKTLTSWELGFLESIKDQFDRTSRLSEKQFETLERIYAEKT